MFYLALYSVMSDAIQHESGIDIHFPLHLHESFELITVIEGDLKVTVGDNVYTLQPGYAALVFPNQLHALETPMHSRYELWIFSPKHVQAYSQAYSDKVPVSNIFPLHPFYLQKLLTIRAGDSAWRFKGVLYSVCTSFDETADYQPVCMDNNQLLLRIFDFVRQNYTGNWV